MYIHKHRSAAESRIPHAMFNLGWMYEFGIGVDAYVYVYMYIHTYIHIYINIGVLPSHAFHMQCSISGGCMSSASG